MSIARLKRMTLGGRTDQQESLLSALQALGCTHLIPLSSDEVQASKAQVIQLPTDASEALAWLSNVQRKRRQDKDRSRVDVEALVAEVLANKHAVNDCRERSDQLEQRITELRHWGEFSLAPAEELGGNLLWFYVVPLKQYGEMSEVTEAGLPWQELHRDQQNAYIAVVSPDEPDEQLMPVERSRVGSEPLSVVERQFEQAHFDLEDLLAEREALTRWIYPLSQSLAASQDRAELVLAGAGALDEGEFFLLQGWVPEDSAQALHRMGEEHGALVLLEDPEPGCEPPTLLQTDEISGGGAEAMGFFQTPNYREWDPGKLVFFSFALFFAMIMSDAVYCAMLGLIILSFKGKMTGSPAGVRLFNLGMFMCLLGVVWGVMVGGYLGFTPPEGSFLGALHVLELNNYDAMMKLSVFIGVAHLMAANGMTAWINRPHPRALAPLGWALLMFGGLMLWFGMSGTVWPWLGNGLGYLGMLGGAGLICVFSSERPVNSRKDLLLRILDGVKAIYNITGAFGDVLSYMRLFALGLSGASLAMTFNSLAGQVVESQPVSGVLFGGLILLLGHVLNFALCVMSGVVHGMRLNVIEFVNWGLSEEGYPFKAFHKRED